MSEYIEDWKDLAKEILSNVPTIDRKTEPNLILPERMERGERFEVGETIVVMNRDDYYDLLCKSWKDETHTDTHDEAIKAIATLIKPKTEPQTDDAYAYDEDDWYDKMERESE